MKEGEPIPPSEPGAAPRGLGPGIGLPISPTLELSRRPVIGLVLIFALGSNLMYLEFPLLFTVNDPPPFCELPSVSQMSRISSKDIGGSQ